jgi:DNA helicase INO80
VEVFPNRELILRLASSSFSFLRFLDSSAKEAHALHLSPLITRRLSAARDEASATDAAPYYL